MASPLGCSSLEVLPFQEAPSRVLPLHRRGDPGNCLPEWDRWTGRFPGYAVTSCIAVAYITGSRVQNSDLNRLHGQLPVIRAIPLGINGPTAPDHEPAALSRKPTSRRRLVTAVSSRKVLRHLQFLFNIIKISNKTAQHGASISLRCPPILFTEK